MKDTTRSKPRRLALIVLKVIYRSWGHWFSLPSLSRLNTVLLHLGLRGLGILNYESPNLTGESHFLRRFLVGKDTPIVVDVGANEGDYALMVRQYAPGARIVCFEPHPQTFQRLLARKDLRAEVFNYAIGDTVGPVELFDYASSDGSSHASIYRDVIEEIHGSRSTVHIVDMVTLDDYCDVNHLRHIDLLKIDTEGHDFAVLRGANRLIADGQIDVIQFEFNEMNVISRTFLRDFRGLLEGYELFRLLPKGWLRLVGNALDEIFAFQNIVAIRME